MVTTTDRSMYVLTAFYLRCLHEWAALLMLTNGRCDALTNSSQVPEYVEHEARTCLEQAVGAVFSLPCGAPSTAPMGNASHVAQMLMFQFDLSY